MINEIKKTCLDTIDRVLHHTSQIQQLSSQTHNKSLNHKLHSLENDAHLLKDNFTLIMAKIMRFESRHNERQSLLNKAQNSFRMREEELRNNYKILEIKHNKLMKELNFVKFSNRNLRDELEGTKDRKSRYRKFDELLSTIETEIHSSNVNIEERIKRIIKDYKKEDLYTPEKLGKNPLKGEGEEWELRWTWKMQEEEKELEQKTKKKKKSREQNTFSSSDKKKREELARLVEQQGRMVQVRERYLSTDLI